MKAAFFRYPREVEIREIETPEPRRSEVLVRVLACGICGSDRSRFYEGKSEWERAGHEYAGVVEKAGPSATRFKRGDLITGIGSIPCGECLNCRSGRPRYCASSRSFGGGAFAELVCHEEVFCEEASGLSAEVASLVEPLTVAMELVEDGRVGLGSSVLLVGAGPIGLLALRLCVLAGAAKVYVAHTSAGSARAQLAREWGASEVMVASGDGLVKAVREREPAGVDAALLTVPPSRVLAEAIQCTRPGGIIAFVGVEWEPTTRLTLPLDAFHFAKQSLIGSNHNPCRRLYPLGVELLRSKRVDGDRLISHRFGLEEIAAAFEFVGSRKSETLKAVVMPFGKG